MVEAQISSGLDEIKGYLRLEISFTEDDNILNSLLLSAESYIKNVTGKKFEDNSNDNNDLYKLAVHMLVTHWYDNRGAVSDKPVSELPFSLQHIIFHLSMCGAYV